MSMGKVLVGVVATMCCCVTSLHAAAHLNKNVALVEPMWVQNDCLMFTLAGVAEADPVKPGSAMFAIARSEPGFKEAYAAILTAKATGALVTVGTTGQLVCGYAQVAFVALP